MSLQANWYSQLQSEGFRDAENTCLPSRPLKNWTGISSQVFLSENEEGIDLIDLIASQSPLMPFETGLPDGPFCAREKLLFHPEFDTVCENICRHGSHTLNSFLVREIWVNYIEGGSNRLIASRLGINDTLVWRTINALTQWMELMELDETTDAPLVKVCLRPFQKQTDEAFIYASWRNSLWYDDDERKEGDAERFFRKTTKAILRILEDPAIRIQIASVDGNDHFIVGYSVATGDCLHFVYVKVDYRNRGIGGLLLPKSFKTISPVLTKIGRAIAIKRGLLKEE